MTPRIVLVALLVSLLAVPVLMPTGLGQFPEGRPPLRLTIAPTMDVANGTLLFGALDSADDARSDPSFVGVKRIVLPRGTLSVCPAEEAQSSSAAIVRGLLADDAPCDEPEVHEDPQLSFGPRSWLQLAGDHASTDDARSGMHMLSTHQREGDHLLATVPTNGSIGYETAGDEIRFQPLIPATQVRVSTAEGNTTYNGTEWRYFFDGTGRFQVHTEGALDRVSTPFAFRFGPMEPSLVSRSMQPRVLLDMQEVILGPDRRASVSNVTAHLDLSRAPPLVNGAAVGRLNGTVHGRDLSAEPVAHVRYAGVDMMYDGEMLFGYDDAEFVLFSGGLVRGDERAGSAPWILFAVLWTAAIVAFFAGRRWVPGGRWTALAETVVPVLAFLVWDQRLGTYFGASGLELLIDPAYGYVAAFRLLAFELLGVVLALVAIYLPLRTLGRRVLPTDRTWIPTAAAGLILLGFLWLFEQDVVAMTLLFARL